MRVRFIPEYFIYVQKNISYATQHTDSKKDVVSFVVVSPGRWIIKVTQWLIDVQGSCCLDISNMYST